MIGNKQEMKKDPFDVIDGVALVLFAVVSLLLPLLFILLKD
jgi:hypothetical protein